MSSPPALPHSSGRSRRRALLAAVALLCALPLTSGAAHAATPPNQAALKTDPLTKGPYSIERDEYSAGDLLLNLSATDPTKGQTLVPLRGSVTFPTGTAKTSKVVVFLHGNYSACRDSTGGAPAAPNPVDAPVGGPTRDNCSIADKANSYAGYDYLSDNLASQGYVVVSAEANFSGVFRSNGADGNLGRSQLLQATLEVIDGWNHGTGVIGFDDPSKPPSSRPSLAGKLDLDGGVGLMGHSRGGDGVTHFIDFNRNNTIGKQWLLDGVLALAPVASAPTVVPEGTNYGLLLPGCDGDVSDLQGDHFYGDAKRDPANANVSLTKWFVQGADHDFYNSVWGSTQDDASRLTGGCGPTDPKTARLSQPEQRATGSAIINSFMRRYVGAETDFDPLMTGETTLPASACPTGASLLIVPCDALVQTSYTAPAAQRLDVLDPAGGAAPPTVAESGGAVAATGLSRYEVCDPKPVVAPAVPVTPTPCPATSPSWGPQLTLGWNAPASLSVGLGAGAGTKDVSGYEALTFDTAVDYGVAENPAGEAKDFAVTLTDADGKTASTQAAFWTGSLRATQRNTSRGPTVLTGVRIPMSAFTGIDTSHVASVTFGFGGTGQPAQGMVQLADVSFLHAPIAPPAATIPPPDGPQPDLGTVLAPGISPVTGAAVPSAPTPSTGTPAACADGKDPSSALRSVSHATKKRTGVVTLSVRGTAKDAATCPQGKGVAKGGVARTLVSVTRTVKGGCRFLTVDAHWSATRSCALPVVLTAKGTKAWSRAIRFRLKSVPGYSAKHRTAITVRAWSYDRAGNRGRTVKRTVHLKA
ncbi:hypothetical protein AB0L40_04760 [Patulibacter sp. NPDC049589]|uniref:hypothetical protein n=1 Tax=Patulibacter sp. NPDC049589 TaxID=3154731 RepID=UPI003423EC3D